MQSKRLVRAEVAPLIVNLLKKQFTKKKMAVFSELGLNKRGRLRADILALSMSSIITIVEVKSSEADFKADNKWELYLPFCNRFYFAVPEGLKLNVPKGIGIIAVNTTGKMRVIQKCKFRSIKSEEVKQNILVRCAFRNSDNNTRKNKGNS